MKTVRINSTRLLEVLRKNRDQHIKDYDEALVGYRQKAVAELSRMLKQAKNNGEIEHHLDVVEPVSYADSYDTAIQMLEYGEDEYVELTQQEFVQYVEDKWTWKASFANTTSLYNIKKS